MPAPRPKVVLNAYGQSTRGIPGGVAGTTQGYQPRVSIPNYQAPDRPGAFGEGVGVGMQGLKEMGGAAIAVGGKQLGSPGMMRYGIGIMDRASAAQQDVLTRAQTYEDIDGFGTFVEWMQFNMGRAAPSVAEVAVSSMIGAAMGGGVGAIPGAFGSGAARKALLKMAKGEILDRAEMRLAQQAINAAGRAQIKKAMVSGGDDLTAITAAVGTGPTEAMQLLKATAIGQGVRGGAHGGGMAAGYELGVGEIGSSLYQATGEIHAGPALVGGIPHAYLEYLPYATLAKSIGKTVRRQAQKDINTIVAERAAAGATPWNPNTAMAKAAAAGVAKSTLIEPITEELQTEVELLVRAGVDPTFDFGGDEAFSQRMHAFIDSIPGGLFFGAPGGVAGGVRGRKEAQGMNVELQKWIDKYGTALDDDLDNPAGGGTGGTPAGTKNILDPTDSAGLPVTPNPAPPNPAPPTPPAAPAPQGPAAAPQEPAPMPQGPIVPPPPDPPAAMDPFYAMFEAHEDAYVTINGKDSAILIAAELEEIRFNSPEEVKAYAIDLSRQQLFQNIQAKIDAGMNLSASDPSVDDFKAMQDALEGAGLPRSAKIDEEIESLNAHIAAEAVPGYVEPTTPGAPAGVASEPSVGTAGDPVSTSQSPQATSGTLSEVEKPKTPTQTEVQDASEEPADQNLDDNRGRDRTPKGGNRVESPKDKLRGRTGRRRKRQVGKTAVGSGLQVDGKSVDPAAKGDPVQPSLSEMPPDLPAAKATVPDQFTTELGSTYEIHANNTTTRNKAKRKGHPNDSGLKDRSDQTYYVKSDDAWRLALPEGNFRIVDHGDDTISLATPDKNTAKWGIAKSNKNIPVSKEPSEGTHPVEVWFKTKTEGSTAYRKAHIGNKITKVQSSKMTEQELFAEQEQEQEQEAKEVAPEAKEDPPAKKPAEKKKQPLATKSPVTPKKKPAKKDNSKPTWIKPREGKPASDAAKQRALSLGIRAKKQPGEKGRWEWLNLKISRFTEVFVKFLNAVVGIDFVRVRSDIDISHAQLERDRNSLYLEGKDFDTALRTGEATKSQADDLLYSIGEFSIHVNERMKRIDVQHHMSTSSVDKEKLSKAHKELSELASALDAYSEDLIDYAEVNLTDKPRKQPKAPVEKKVPFKPKENYAGPPRVSFLVTWMTENKIQLKPRETTSWNKVKTKGVALDNSTLFGEDREDEIQRALDLIKEVDAFVESLNKKKSHPDFSVKLSTFSAELVDYYSDSPKKAKVAPEPTIRPLVEPSKKMATHIANFQADVEADMRASLEKGRTVKVPPALSVKYDPFRQVEARVDPDTQGIELFTTSKKHPDDKSPGLVPGKAGEKRGPDFDDIDGLIRGLTEADQRSPAEIAADSAEIIEASKAARKHTIYRKLKQAFTAVPKYEKKKDSSERIGIARANDAARHFDDKYKKDDRRKNYRIIGEKGSDQVFLINKFDDVIQEFDSIDAFIKKWEEKDKEEKAKDSGTRFSMHRDPDLSDERAPSRAENPDYSPYSGNKQSGIERLNRLSKDDREALYSRIKTHLTDFFESWDGVYDIVRYLRERSVDPTVDTGQAYYKKDYVRTDGTIGIGTDNLPSAGRAPYGWGKVQAFEKYFEDHYHDDRPNDALDTDAQIEKAMDVMVEYVAVRILHREGILSSKESGNQLAMATYSLFEKALKDNVTGIRPDLRMLIFFNGDLDYQGEKFKSYSAEQMAKKLAERRSNAEALYKDLRTEYESMMKVLGESADPDSYIGTRFSQHRDAKLAEADELDSLDETIDDELYSLPVEMMKRIFELKDAITQAYADGTHETKEVEDQDAELDHLYNEAEAILDAAHEDMGAIETDNDRYKAPEIPEGASSVASLEAALSKVLAAKGWTETTRPHIVQSVVELPFDAPANIPGVYHNGEVWLIADNIATGREQHAFLEALFHEQVGHVGVRRILGDRLNDTLDRVWESYSDSEAMLKNIDVYFPDGDFDSNNPEHTRLAAEEFIALRAQQVLLDGTTMPGFIKQIVAAVRQFLADHGFTVKMSDQDVLALIVAADKSLQGRRKFSDQVQRGLRFAMDNEPLWFSQMRRQIEDHLPDSATNANNAKRIKRWIGSGLITSEEVEWSGILDELQRRGQDKMSKEEVLQYLADNEVVVTENVLGSVPPKEWREAGAAYAEANLRRDNAERVLRARKIEHVKADIDYLDELNDLPNRKNSIANYKKALDKAEKLMEEAKLEAEKTTKEANRLSKEFSKVQQANPATGWEARHDRWTQRGGVGYQELLLFYTPKGKPGEVEKAPKEYKDALFYYDALVDDVRDLTSWDQHDLDLLNKWDHDETVLSEMEKDHVRDMLEQSQMDMVTRSRMVFLGQGIYRAAKGNRFFIGTSHRKYRNIEDRFFVYQEEQQALEGDHDAALFQTNSFEEALSVATGSTQGNVFSSDHFPDTNNFFAHVRFKTRFDADGNKVLFIEEYQSDWNTRARKIRQDRIAQLINQNYTKAQAESLIPETFGYGDTPGMIWTRVSGDEMTSESTRGDGRKWRWTIVRKADNHFDLINPANIPEKFSSLADAKRHAEAINSEMVESVPDLPFKQSALKMGMRRMIRHAAENGYDKIAWTPAEMQLRLYDTGFNGRVEWTVNRKNIDIVLSNPKTDRSTDLIISHKGEVVSGDQLNLNINRQKDISDFLPPGIVDEILGSPSGHRQMIDDVSIGDQKAPLIYDKNMVRDTARYVKQWGATVEKSPIIFNKTNARVRMLNGTPTVLDNQPPTEDNTDSDDRVEFPTIAAAEAEVERRNRQHAMERSESLGQDVHSVTITPEMRQAARRAAPMFSRPAKNPTTDEQTRFSMHNAMDEAIAPELEDSGHKQGKTDKLRGARPWFLGGFSLDQILEVWDDLFDKGLAHHGVTYGKFDASKVERQTRGVDVGQRLWDYHDSHTDTETGQYGSSMTRLFLDGTFFKLTPHGPFEEGLNMEETKSMLRQANLEYDAMEKMSSSKEKEEELALAKKAIQVMERDIREEDTRKEMHDELVLIYAALDGKYDPKTKKGSGPLGLYHDTLNHLEENFEAMEKALHDRVDRILDAMGVDRESDMEKSRKELHDEIRLRFDEARGIGIYFPLSRFGDYILIGERLDEFGDLDRRVSAYDSATRANAEEKKWMEEEGYAVVQKHKKEYDPVNDGVSTGFVQNLFDALDKHGIEDESLLDEINQMAIRSLPDLSTRKHFGHRKFISGYTQDFVRAFSHSSFHAAHHIARIEYADIIRGEIKEMQKDTDEVEDYTKNTGQTGEARTKSAKMQQVVNELLLRQKAAMNPQGHPAVNFLGSMGFAWMIGPGIAGTLINASQVGMFTMPWLGSKYGFWSANKELLDAYKLLHGERKTHLTDDGEIEPNKRQLDNWFDLEQSEKLVKHQKEMQKKHKEYNFSECLQELKNDGTISVTQTHDLSGLANLDFSVQFNSAAARKLFQAMRMVAYPFHTAEVINRQVTAKAAYDLAIKGVKGVKGRKGHPAMSHKKAVAFARTAINSTHFNYRSTNRARYMQGNVGRIVFMFRQYALNVMFLQGRAIRNIFVGFRKNKKGVVDKNSEEYQAAVEATKMLSAIYGLHFAVAGAVGLPIWGASEMMINAIMNGFGDDDDPYDFKTNFRNFMADTLGTTAGEFISHGAIRGLGADVSARMSIDVMDMMLPRTPDTQSQGRRKFQEMFTAVGGPVVSIASNLYAGMSQWSQGDIYRGTETMMPRFIRDFMRGGRYFVEGVTTHEGEELMDISAWEAGLQALGFTPGDVAEMYQGRRSIKKKETLLNRRRRELLNKYDKARRAGARKRLRSLRSEIRKFNAINPEFEIRKEHLQASKKSKQRARRQTKRGTYLQTERKDLRRVGRFANIGN